MLVDALNDFDRLAAPFAYSNETPSRLHSTLPTILGMAGDVRGKRVLDLGCGAGFFSRELAIRGGCVTGLDNAPTQIERARSLSGGSLYIERDIFLGGLPAADLIIAPYVANYARDTQELLRLFVAASLSLPRGGRLILAMDDPVPTVGECFDPRFGFTKKLVHADQQGIDGALIWVDLYREEQQLCSLHARYVCPRTIGRLLAQAGFCNIRRHRPTISQKGKKMFGKGFWDRFVQNSSLMYLSAMKA